MNNAALYWCIVLIFMEMELKIEIIKIKILKKNLVRLLSLFAACEGISSPSPVVVIIIQNIFLLFVMGKNICKCWWLHMRTRRHTQREGRWYRILWCSTEKLTCAPMDWITLSTQTLRTQGEPVGIFLFLMHAEVHYYLFYYWSSEIKCITFFLLFSGGDVFVSLCLWLCATRKVASVTWHQHKSQWMHEK